MWNHILSQPSDENGEEHNTNTSVSGDWTTMRGKSDAACFACNKSLISASSWSEYNAAISIAYPDLFHYLKPHQL